MENPWPAPQCPDHPGNILEYFCLKDNEPTCKICMIFGLHWGHDAMYFYEWR